MNERLMASLLRSEIKKLSEERRSLYQFGRALSVN